MLTVKQGKVYARQYRTCAIPSPFTDSFSVAPIATARTNSYNIPESRKMQILLAEDDNSEQALYFCVRQRRRLSSNPESSVSISSTDENRRVPVQSLQETQADSVVSLSDSLSSSESSPSRYIDSWKSLQDQAVLICIKVQECVFTLWEYSTNQLAASHVDDLWLQRFSILLIAFEYLRQELLECFILQQQQPYSIYSESHSGPSYYSTGGTLGMLFSSNSNYTTSSFTSYSTTATSNHDFHSHSQKSYHSGEEHLQAIWLIPIFTALASFTFFLSLMVQIAPGSQAIVLVGMMSLALVECCLVPVALTGCSALFWFDVLTAETSLVMLFLVWVTASVSSRCIRCALYPSLGHG